MTRPGFGQVADAATWAPERATEALRHCLDTFPEVAFTVSGHCMRPALQHGDRVFLKRLAGAEARLGDVVLVSSQGRLLLHRLVIGRRLGRLARGYRTMADRALLLDPPLRRADILGRVVSRDGRPLPARWVPALVSLARAVLVRLRRAMSFLR